MKLNEMGRENANFPLTEFEDLLAADPLAEKLWKYFLGADKWEEVHSHFEKMGRGGAQATSHSDVVDKNSPQLKRFDASGLRICEIVHHPSYQKLRELSYGQGIVAIKYEEDFLAENRKIRHMTGFGAGYYFAQTEPGLYCPICMTDSLGRALEIHGRSEVAQKTIEHLASRDMDQLWEGAMFLTEKQGGSDVGANTVQAENIEGDWYLSGDKWFCSNIDAKAILALARMPGEEGALSRGTRGLGLFLILREAAGNGATINVHQLKNKLGVRSNACGEVTLEKTKAHLIGGADAGFKMMTDMVNMSRLYNSVASIAVSRRAILEAMAYGSQRRAFGKELTQQPLWRAMMSDLIAEEFAMRAFVFETVRTLDKADAGDTQAESLIRLMTPMAKAISGKFVVFATSEAMEAIGGNAYIETSILPRLFRDGQVLPIWEGTTIIQSLDILRVFSKQGVGSFFNRITESLLVENAVMKEFIGTKSEELEMILRGMEKSSPEDQQLQARDVLGRMTRLLQVSILLEMSRDEGLKNIAEAAFARISQRETLTSPLGCGDMRGLAATEDVLLKSAYSY